MLSPVHWIAVSTPDETIARRCGFARIRPATGTFGAISGWKSRTRMSAQAYSIQMTLLPLFLAAELAATPLPSSTAPRAVVPVAHTKLLRFIPVLTFR